MTSLAENCFFEPRASEQPGFTPVHGIWEETSRDANRLILLRIPAESGPARKITHVHRPTRPNGSIGRSGVLRGLANPSAANA